MAEKAKFQFNGQTYSSKGRLCHDIVKYYVEQNPNATLAALQKVFNIGTRIIVATPEMALTVVNSDGKSGGDYYMKEADQIALKGGKVVVWSYWPESYFKPFMEQVKALGMEVVEQDAKQEADSVTGEPVAGLQTADTPKISHEEVTNEVDNKIESQDSSMQLEDFVVAALADGVLTDKEKKVLMRKAESFGVDPDEFELILESRLHKKQLETGNTGPVKWDAVKRQVSYYKDTFEKTVGSEERLKCVETKKLLYTRKDGRKAYKRNKDFVNYKEVTERATIQAKKDYIMSLEPLDKEDVLAVVSFLDTLLPTAGKTNPFLPEVAAKYNSVVVKAQHFYSNDTDFIKELNMMKAPFLNASKALDSHIDFSKRSENDARKKKIGIRVWLIMVTVFYIAGLGLVWLLYDVLDSAALPIVFDISLLIFGGIILYFQFWVLKDRLEKTRKEYDGHKKDYDMYVLAKQQFSI